MQKRKKLHLEKFVERDENKHHNKGLKVVFQCTCLHK